METHQESFGEPTHVETSSAQRVTSLRGSIVVLCASVLATMGGGCTEEKPQVVLAERPRMTRTEYIRQRQEQVWIHLCKKMYDKGYNMFFTEMPGEFLIAERTKEREDYGFVMEVREKEIVLFLVEADFEFECGNFQNPEEVLQKLPTVVPVPTKIVPTGSGTPPNVVRSARKSALPARSAAPADFQD